jgi:hypothetical protein
LDFKSHRLCFLSIAARFQPSFLEWVSSLGRFFGLYGAASILYFGKHAALGFTSRLWSFNASQNRVFWKDLGVCTFATNNQEAFDCFAKSIFLFGKYAALGFTDRL